MKAEKLSLGVDPGLRGAFALIYGRRVVRVWDMPIEEKPSGGNRVDVVRLMQVMSQIQSEALRFPAILRVAVEHVHAMPGQGVSTMFSMGYSYGTARAALALLPTVMLPATIIVPVTASVWKKALKFPENAPKSYSIDRAKRTLSESSSYLRLAKHEGRAEAMLLAHYCSKFQTK